MVKIEMMTDEGLLREIIEKVHVCVGDPAHCPYSAMCERCGLDATAEFRVYVWTTTVGVNYFLCGGCVFDFPYVKFLLEVGLRVQIWTFDDRESYQGEIVALLPDGRVTVRDDPMGEDHEMIRAVVRPI